ncbi:unnamed protein product [Symbiodinium sp. CCMP2592]|nr:unnamed protein product [Symbiodinium sp. CCMP2592]
MTKPNLSVAPFAALTVFGFTLRSALLEYDNIPRTADVFECWSGQGSIAKAAEDSNLVATVYDKYRPGADPAEDLTFESGFRLALTRVMALKPGSLAWFAPPCGTFTWLDRHHSKRTKQNPLGNEDYAPVRNANLQAMAMIFMVCLCLLRDVLPVVEQPAQSQMFRLPTIAHVFEKLNLTSTTCTRCSFDDSEWGDRIFKRYKFVGQAWIQNLHRTCYCPHGKHKELVSVRFCKKSKKTKKTGKKALLVLSGRYPPRLGRFIVDVWLANRDQPDGEVVEKKSKTPRPKGKVTVKRKGANAKAKSSRQKPKPEARKASTSESWKQMETGSHQEDEPASKQVRVSDWKQMDLGADDPDEQGSLDTDWKKMLL